MYFYVKIALVKNIYLMEFLVQGKGVGLLQEIGKIAIVQDVLHQEGMLDCQKKHVR